MLNQLLSNRVEKTPSTEVSADRYEYLALAEAEPDLGVPAGNSYILASTTTGTRSWIDPATNLTAPGSNTQVVFNNSGVLASAASLVYDTATGRVGIGVASPTSRLDIAETWNNAGTAFTLIKANVTDTASNASSLLIDLQVGGTSSFKINKSGELSLLNSGAVIRGLYNSSFYFSGAIRVQGDTWINRSSAIKWDSAGWPSSNTTDLVILRDAANTLAQRNGTSSQTLRIYNTFTDASNYERATIGWNSNILQIGTEAAGTGTRRSINLNYTTTIDGNSRTNVPALTITNVGAGNGGLLVGQLQVGYQQDWTRLTAFYTANKALAYSHGGTGVANQGAHRFSTDSTFGSWVGANGSVVDILAPSTISNIFQCRQSDGTIVLNVAYNGSVTTANTVTASAEATTLATTSKTQVASFPVASFRSGKLIVQAYDSVTGEVQISELLVAHNGSTASATEYGVVYTGSNSIVTYDVDISAGNVRLMATRTTANSTQYKISETLMVA